MKNNIQISQEDADNISDQIIDAYSDKISEKQQLAVYISKPKIRRKKEEDFVMYFQALSSLQIAKRIKPNTARVFLFFLAKVAYSNHIGMDVLTVSEELEISKKTTITCLNELKGFNIIISYDDQQDKRRNVYIINPLVAWKGTDEHRDKVKQKLIDKRQLSLDF